MPPKKKVVEVAAPVAEPVKVEVIPEPVKVTKSRAKAKKVAEEPKEPEIEVPVKKGRGKSASETIKKAKAEPETVKKSKAESETKVELSSDEFNKLWNDLKNRWGEINKKIEDHARMGIILEEEKNTILKELWALTEKDKPKTTSIFDIGENKSSTKVHQIQNKKLDSSESEDSDSSSESESDSPQPIIKKRVTKKKVEESEESDESSDSN